MSALGIILIAFGVIVLVLFVLGMFGAARHRRQQDAEFEQRLVAANEALADARAADQGWDLPALEAAAMAVLADRHPNTNVRGIHLVQVIDRPGIDEDQARFHVDVAMGRDFEILLGRRGGDWAEVGPA